MGSPPTVTPPGWYPDPGGGGLRWWDGWAWTEFAVARIPSSAGGLLAAHVPPVEVRPSATQPLDPAARKSLVWETRFVMVAFLLPAVMAAVILFAQHAAGVGTVTRFPVIVKGHPVSNLILGTLDYLPVASTVPLALFLLARTGQPPSALGIAIPSFSRDILPGLGLAAASFGTELLLLLPFAPLLMNSKLVNQVPVGHVPGYYVIWGIAISATTAVTEEVLVNGYLLTRLEQLGWSPRRALVLSLVLRTSYHVYYGLGFLLTVPFGYFVTRSFQKHRRLNRPIAAHFLFDAILTTIAILG